MKAWQLDRLGGDLSLNIVPVPEPRSGSVLVKLEASALMSYLKAYVEGKLPVYRAPRGWFTPGGNGVGVIQAVGHDVWHLKVGQRVVTSSHFKTGENFREPGQFLIGITAFGPIAEAMQADWPHGTLAEYALLPSSTVTPVEALEQIGSVQLAVLARFVVPCGGLLRGRLKPGETLIVTGATGAYGSAAVLLALAMGAGSVVASGRNRRALEALAEIGGPRVVPVVLTGDLDRDAAALRSAAHGGAQMAFDMVGNAMDSNATVAGLRSLRRGDRLVLMGSMTSPLSLSYMELMANNLEIIGNFMYPADAYLTLLDLVRSGLLDLGHIRPLAFPLDALPEAMQAAANADSLRCVVVHPSA